MRQIFFLIAALFSIVLLSSCGGKGIDNKDVSDTLVSTIDRLNKMIEENPDADSLYKQRAEYYLSEGQPEKALTDIRIAIQKNNAKTEYHILMADIYLSMQNIDACRKTLMKAFDMDPRNAEPSLKLAELNLFLKDYDKVYLYCSKAIEIDKYSAKAYFIKGFALLEQQDTTEAIYNLQQATQNDAEYYDAFMLLGHVFDVKNDPIAGNYLKTAVKINPESVEARYHYGLWLQNQGMIDDAMIQYEALLLIDPKNASAWYNSGYIYLVFLENFRVAVEKFSKAIEYSPGFAEAYMNRGLAYEELEMFDKARADYKKALQLKENFDKAIEGLNRIEGK